MSDEMLDHFDAWYAELSDGGSARDELTNRHLGLPTELRSTSLLSMAGLQEVRDALRLSPGDRLLDAACGRCGYGAWLARETAADVVGVDFSPVAVRLAAETVAGVGLDPSRAELRVGGLEATGLPDDSVDAAICIDSIQFAADIVAACRELGRVVRPGGPIVVTCWQPTDPAERVLPERMRRVDLAPQLREAGLADVVVEERPSWLELEQRMWQEALEVDPSGDVGLEGLREEAGRVLPTLGHTRRVLAIARSQSRAGSAASGSMP